MFGMSELPNRWIAERHLAAQIQLAAPLKEEMDR
jgi:hypothetical protein